MNSTHIPWSLVPCKGCGQQIAISQAQSKSQPDGFLCIDCHKRGIDTAKPRILADLIEAWEQAKEEMEATEIALASALSKHDGAFRNGVVYRYLKEQGVIVRDDVPDASGIFY